MRLRIRAMPRHSQNSSPPRIAVRRTASCGRLCRWSMLGCSKQMPVEAFASAASAWMTNGKNERKDSEAKRRQTQREFAVPSGTAAPPYGRRTSIGVPPRLWLRRPNATAQLQSALPGMGPVSGRYPQTDPSQYSEAPRRPVVVPVGRVPEAARERVASPPAGTALAPRSGMPAGLRPNHWARFGSIGN